MTAGSLVAWKSSRSVLLVAVSLIRGSPPAVRWLGRASVPEIGWLANYGPGSAEATIVRRLGEPVLFVTT